MYYEEKFRDDQCKELYTKKEPYKLIHKTGSDDNDYLDGSCIKYGKE